MTAFGVVTDHEVAHGGLVTLCCWLRKRSVELNLVLVLGNAGQFIWLRVIADCGHEVPSNKNAKADLDQSILFIILILLVPPNPSRSTWQAARASRWISK